MLKRVLTGVVLALALFGVVSCGAKQPTKIVIATDATFPPMETVDENKNIVGFDIDLFTAVAKASNINVEFVNTAWQGIFAGLENDKYDAIVSSVTITDERKAKYDFSSPYVNAGQVLVVPASLNGVETLQDLTGKTVGAQIGTTGAFAIDKVPTVKKKEYNDIGLAFAALAKGDIVGVVVDRPVAASYALQNPDYKGKYKMVGKTFTDEYYAAVVKKGNKKVLDMLNAGLKKVIDSGEIKTFEAKWL